MSIVQFKKKLYIREANDFTFQPKIIIVSDYNNSKNIITHNTYNY